MTNYLFIVHNNKLTAITITAITAITATTEAASRDTTYSIAIVYTLKHITGAHFTHSLLFKKIKKIKKGCEN